MTPLAALQATLAAEHAAVYAYGVVGGRVSTSAEPALAAGVREAYAVHRARRDLLTSMVLDAGGDPVAAAVSYRMPTPARTAGQQRLAARRLEDRLARVYAQLVGSTSGAPRRWAIDALGDSAVRVLGFGGRPSAFPGLAEL